MKRIIVVVLVMAIYGSLLSQDIHDQPLIINGIAVPVDFPMLVTTVQKETAPGNIFMANYDGSPYLMVFRNDGTPIYYRRLEYKSRDFKLQSTGDLSYCISRETGFAIMDVNYSIIDTFSCQHGYLTDEHELQILPNGNALMIAREDAEMDLSQFIQGGNPKTIVLKNYIQEVTPEDSVVFEWDCWDYFNVEDTYRPLVDVNFLDYIHMNSLAVDYDGNLVVSSRHLSECTKINRETKDIIWRLGGKNNQFSFANDPDQISYQHDIRPVPGKPNHYTIFDNGNDKRPQYSRVVEYRLDTCTMTAYKVWEYRHDPDWYSYWMGNAQRLTNGNTFICFVRPNLSKAIEVSPEGEIVYEANLGIESNVYRAFRFELNGFMLKPYLVVEPFCDRTRLIFNKFGDESVSYYNVYGGREGESMELIDSTRQTWMDLKELNSYTYYNFEVTAVDTYGVESASSTVEQVFSRNIQRGGDLILNGDFSDGEVFWELGNEGGASSAGIIIDSVYRFEIDLAGSEDSDIQFSQGDIPLVQGSEYILEFDARADSSRLIEVMIEKAIYPYTNYSKTGNVYITQQFQHFEFTFMMEEPSYLRSRFVMNAGKSNRDFELTNISLKELRDFRLPFIEVSTPNGGEQLQIGESYGITWDDNIEENVILELCVGELTEIVIDTLESNGAYQWILPDALETGGDYKIKIKGLKDHSVMDVSDSCFALIDTIDTRVNETEVYDQSLIIYPNPTDGRVQVRYNLQNQEYVTIRLFDSTGRMSHCLFEGIQSSGLNEVSYELEGLRSSPYILELRSENKMIRRILIIN